MFLLSHHAEEFHGLIKAELVTMNAGPTDNELTPYPAILVVTSQKVYFLRITAPYRHGIYTLTKYPIVILKSVELSLVLPI